MLALAHIGNSIEPQAGQRALHSTPLWVENLRLQHDVDDDAGHGHSSVRERVGPGKTSSLASGERPSAERHELEGVAVHGAERAEVPPIEGRDPRRPITVGQNHERCIRHLNR